MKSKEVKRHEAVERNEQYRGKYIAQATKEGISDPDKVKVYCDQKIGIRKQDR